MVKKYEVHVSYVLADKESGEFYRRDNRVILFRTRREAAQNRSLHWVMWPGQWTIKKVKTRVVG